MRLKIKLQQDQKTENTRISLLCSLETAKRCGMKFGTEYRTMGRSGVPRMSHFLSDDILLASSDDLTHSQGTFECALATHTKEFPFLSTLKFAHYPTVSSLRVPRRGLYLSAPFQLRDRKSNERAAGSMLVLPKSWRSCDSAINSFQRRFSHLSRMVCERFPSC
jgi:hypothetical protein